MKNILIVYSNPAQSESIRLDKEQRAIDHVLERVKIGTDRIERKHAATFGDLTRALAAKQYDLIQFSGHGVSSGICLEAEAGDNGETVSANRLCSLLLKTQTKLTVTVLMCCYSAATIPVLLKGTPYLVAVFGRADNDASIRFVSLFIERYLQEDSVERAFSVAQSIVEDDLDVVLVRRSGPEAPGRVLFHVFPQHTSLGSIVVDLTEAEADIAKLPVAREKVLSLLSRKLRIHRWIFGSPRERAVIPMGRFVGVFSWVNAADIVTCHRILRIKEGADDLALMAWTDFVVVYNDHCNLRYRTLEYPANPENGGTLKSAIAKLRDEFQYFFESGKHVSVFKRLVPEQFKITKAFMSSSIERAEAKFAEDDFGSTVAALETALSAEHDLLDATTEILTE